MTTPQAHSDEARERVLRAAGIDPNRVPEHVAVIMDGNGRWAKRRGEARVFGHAHGVESVRCLLYTSPSPRDVEESRMPSSA